MAKIVKHSGSLRVSIPPKALKALGIEKGHKVSVAIRGEEIVLRAADDALASIPTEDLRAELRRRGEV